MERLTRYYSDDGVCTYVGPGRKYKTGDMPGEMNEEKVSAVLCKLKDYEETGLEPEEVERLKEYMQPFTIQDMGRFREIMQAEKEGRLLVLPFKPGTEYFAHCHVRNANPISTGRFYPPYIPTLGVNAWLTKEEAEAALKEQEG